MLLDEYAANTNPEWVARNADGASATAIAGMLERGYDPTVDADRRRFAHEVTLAYMKRFGDMVRASAPEATVYFNSRPLAGLPHDAPLMSHVEIEALPTGGWGYLYFPKNVRYARSFGKPYMGMTGRFHKSWADFGGLKPYAALQYEVCQMLAYGAECSVGDQLHPRGEPDPVVYELIGRVYAHAEACEPWTTGAKPISQIAVLRSVADAGVYREEPGGTNDGVTRLLGHLKHQFDFLDPQMRFERYELLILPDAIEVDARLAGRLRSYLSKGGKVIFSGSSGLDDKLRPVVPEMGVSVDGESPYQTTYLRFGPAVADGVPATDHVMYERGIRMKPARDAKALARVIEPYFDRDYRHFSSHAQTPPNPAGSAYSAAIRRGSVITIPYPIFKAYGTHASLAYRSLVGNCIALLVEPLVIVTAPSTMEVTVMRQNRRTVVHLLQFVGDRRTDALDLVEDIIPLYDVPLSLRADRAPRRAYLAPSREALAVAFTRGRARVTVPVVEGHQMVVFE